MWLSSRGSCDQSASARPIAPRFRSRFVELLFARRDYPWVIATDGIATPDQAWQVGLDRTEEMFVVVLKLLPITALLWPRQARERIPRGLHNHLQSG